MADLRRSGRLLVVAESNPDRADSDDEERGVGTVGGVCWITSDVEVLGAGGGVLREAGCIGVGTKGGEIIEGGGVDGRFCSGALAVDAPVVLGSDSEAEAPFVGEAGLAVSRVD